MVKKKTNNLKFSCQVKARLVNEGFYKTHNFLKKCIIYTQSRLIIFKNLPSYDFSSFNYASANKNNRINKVKKLCNN